MNIAVLYDGRGPAEAVHRILTQAGHACAPYRREADLLHALERQPADMLIIDWGAKQVDGVAVMRWVRTHLPPPFPVLFLTDRAGEEDILTALQAGANDYLMAPIRRAELVTRVQVQFRRAYPDAHAAEQIEIGNYHFNVRAGRLVMAGKPVGLTRKEFDLALLFFQHLDRPLSRAYIRESVWASEVAVSSRTMDTHVSRVRSKLGLRPERGYRLAPVYSFGYRLEKLEQMPG